MLSYSLAANLTCFCSFRVKCVCYVPIYSQLNVMEPRNIPEITPRILLALSTVSSRVHDLTVGSICTCIYYPAPPSAVSISPFALGICGTECLMRFQRCAAPSDTHQSPVRSDSSRCNSRVIPPPRFTLFLSILSLSHYR